ncbi:endoglucanase IV precursor [Aspergillus terreus]|nr:endoglucanase IV precursor [Aspergillus terreus]
MSLSKIATGILASATLVAGHGYVSGIVADGKYYSGYLVDKYSYMDDPPETIGWSTTATDLGFVDGTGYDTVDIACHKGSAPGALTATVPAGSKIEMQWNTWPESHHGPVLNYLAPCNGDCAQADKSSLEFFKIEAEGLIDGSSPPGQWATDELISNNNTAVVTIPASIASGNYVLRHEIIGLHSAGNLNGAQNYPQCINIEITGGGSTKPSGVSATTFYKNTDPGIKFDIYSDLSGGYPMPGPALFDA